MAKLSSTTRRKLKHLHTAGNAPLNPNKLACWNWALSGFGANALNPDTAFSYVAGWIQQNDMRQQFQERGPLAQLNALKAKWQPYQGANAVSDNSKKAFKEVTAGIVKLAIKANGLSWSSKQTPYQLCMYYDDGLNADGELRAPNYTHWWLKIDGGGANYESIESFPGSTNITFRPQEYANNHVFRIYLSALQQSHVQKIEAGLQHLIRGNHNKVAHGAWAADNSRNDCTICNDNFTLVNRRHHCRCCGRLVCGSCSPNTRAGVAKVQHPNGKDGNGPQRVCLYCE